MKKKVIFSIFISGLAIVALFSTVSAYAQTTPQRKYLQVVQKIAQKFGLKEDDVQDVFDEDQ